MEPQLFHCFFLLVDTQVEPLPVWTLVCSELHVRWPQPRAPHVSPDPSQWQDYGLCGPTQAQVPARWASQPLVHEEQVSSGHKAVNPSWDGQH